LKNFFTDLISSLTTILTSAFSKKVDDAILVAAHQAVKKGAVIIDVRTKIEYQKQHIPNALNISIQELSKSVTRVPKNKVLVLYCRSGSRSSVATQILSQKGWKVYDVATQSEYNRKIEVSVHK